MLRVGLHLLRGALIAAAVFPLAGELARRAHVRAWSRRLLEILAVRLAVTGARPRRSDVPVMLVANHVSWLDVVAISAVLPVYFVAKSEVRAWPLVGWMSEKAGTLFIDRARRRDTARVIAKLVRLLRDGAPVAVFPEATTTDGSAVLEFHASLLQPAVLAGAMLRPVAVRYACADGAPCAEAAFTGGRSLWESLNLLVTQREIRAQLAFLPPLAAQGEHRRGLAHAAREAILRTLFPRVPGNRAGTTAGPRAAVH